MRIWDVCCQGPPNLFRGILELIAGLVLFAASVSAQQITVSGYTEPYAVAKLGVSVPGQIARIDFPEGAFVQKGKTILALDQQAEKLEVQRRKLLLESKVEVQAAAKQIETLQSHLSATRQLFRETGSVSKEQMEKEELEHDLALFERQRLEAIEQREKIEYGIAREQLARRNLRAPFSGRIAELFVKVGENCEIDTPLVRLVDTTKGYFIANVKLDVGRQLKLGQRVRLELQTGGTAAIREAEMVFISPVVDPASGLRKIKAVFDNRDGRIVPGVSGVMVVDPSEPE